jgi:hypothetical protein
MSSWVEAPVRHDEAILDYSPATRSYRYTIDGGLPVADNQDRYAVEPAGNGAQIIWESASRSWTRGELSYAASHAGQWRSARPCSGRVKRPGRRVAR